jgi:hypothetical protein
VRVTNTPCWWKTLNCWASKSLQAPKGSSPFSTDSLRVRNTAAVPWLGSLSTGSLAGHLQHVFRLRLRERHLLRHFNRVLVPEVPILLHGQCAAVLVAQPACGEHIRFQTLAKPLWRNSLPLCRTRAKYAPLGTYCIKHGTFGNGRQSPSGDTCWVRSLVFRMLIATVGWSVVGLCTPRHPTTSRYAIG